MSEGKRKPAEGQAHGRLPSLSQTFGSTSGGGASSAVVTTDFEGQRLRRIAAQARINDVKQLAKWRQDSGHYVDLDAVAFLVAQARSSAKAGYVALPSAKAKDGSTTPRRWLFKSCDRDVVMNDLRGLMPASEAKEAAERGMQAASTFAFSRQSFGLLDNESAGKALQVTADERQGLNAWSLDAVDEPASQRRARLAKERREAQAERMRAKRRADGRKPRKVYEGHSLEKTRPWEALGMSRRTYFRQRNLSDQERKRWFDPRLNEAAKLVADTVRQIRRHDRHTAWAVLESTRYHMTQARRSRAVGAGEADMRLRDYILADALFLSSAVVKGAGQDSSGLDRAEALMRRALCA